MHILVTQVIQALYFTISSINDFYGSNEVGLVDRPLIRRLKDYVFATFAFPLGIHVAGLFWTIYAFDRQLVMPEAVDRFFPSWLNHIIHTNVAIFVAIELVSLHRQYPSRKQGLFGLMTFMVCYIIWLHIIRLIAGRWVYPILDTLNLPGKVAFLMFTGCLPAIIYLAGEVLNSKIWNRERLAKNNRGAK